MNSQKIDKFPPPPGVINSLRAGYGVVSSHVWLILMPIVFDSFLWLGPRLSAGRLYSSLVSGLLEILKDRPLPATEMKTITDSVETFGRLNWLSWIRTFPVGISSLEAFFVADKFTLQTPIGLQNVIHFNSITSMLGWTLLLTLIGWVGGSVYFRLVSLASLGREDAGISVVRAVIQTIILSVVWIICLIIVTMPISLIVGAVGLLSPGLSNAILFVLVLLSYWLIVPLFFTPHGIFTRRQNALYSVYTSLRMSRFTFPTSGMFVLTVFLVTRGLDFLWSVPTNDTWMKLVGIFGHAFISTTLLAASFIYYRDINTWLQIVLEQIQQKRGMPTQQA